MKMPTTMSWCHMYKGVMWTEERRQTLSHLINVELRPYSQIAAILSERWGEEISRESVAGAVKRWRIRVGMAPMHKSIKLKAFKEGKPEKPTRVEVTGHPDHMLNIPFKRIRNGTCKFETSGFWVQPKDFKFCGLPTEAGHVQYCEHHMSLSYRPPYQRSQQRSSPGPSYRPT